MLGRCPTADGAYRTGEPKTLGSKKREGEPRALIHESDAAFHDTAVRISLD
jgi:hypothetical protein